MRLDISKAFDKLDWRFLFKCLNEFVFSELRVNLVKECVCNSKGSDLINGEISSFFPTACGLRYGDPYPLTFPS